MDSVPKLFTARTDIEADGSEFEFHETSIPGCFVVRLATHYDSRGVFVKAVHAATFAARGLRSDFSETFYTVSGENVLRGMHLQLPPADHSKLIYCLAGSVMDVALDLRRGSPAFGQYNIVEISAEHRKGVYLPSGIAHGFQVRQAPAVIMYHVTSEHTASLDAGVRWDSFGVTWPNADAVISARDARLPKLGDFRTPFEFELKGSGGRE